MEPVFEVRYRADRKMLKEHFRAIGGGVKPGLAILFWVGYVLIFLHSYFTDTIQELWIMLLVMGIVMPVFLFMPSWYAWLTLRNVRKQYDGIQPETVVTFGDTIKIHEGIASYTIEYHKLIRTIRLKHGYLIMIGKRNGFLLDPNGFTKGTFEDLKKFLAEKRPDLSIAD